jgi:hypothetical protein
MNSHTIKEGTMKVTEKDWGEGIGMKFVVEDFTPPEGDCVFIYRGTAYRTIRGYGEFKGCLENKIAPMAYFDKDWGVVVPLDDTHTVWNPAPKKPEPTKRDYPTDEYGNILNGEENL